MSRSDIEQAIDESTTARQKLSTKKKRAPFSWTQPCCAECWQGLVLKTGKPTKSSDARFCCYCRSDIEGGKGYDLRVNPGNTPYPTLRKDEDH